MPKKIMTIEELTAKLPEEFHPVAAKYGPVLLDMAVDELWNWLELMVMGKIVVAYQVLISRMPNSDLLAELDKLNVDWEKENKANAQRLDLQRNALFAILRVVLQMVLALVGL